MSLKIAKAIYVVLTFFLLVVALAVVDNIQAQFGSNYRGGTGAILGVVAQQGSMLFALFAFVITGIVWFYLPKG